MTCPAKLVGQLGRAILWGRGTGGGRGSAGRKRGAIPYGVPGVTGSQVRFFEVPWGLLTPVGVSGEGRKEIWYDSWWVEGMGGKG